MLFRYIN
ncbi:uncharacterized protein FFC1_12453 [Fusarium fujikuroi]|nr:uncharacterized protein FFC1_12453 [Fusarium fujikuroi]